MTLEHFKDSLKLDSPAENLNIFLQSLWHDAKGNWEKAHQIAQSINSKNGSRIHAYLHRKEGDLSNAQYWYSKADEKMPEYSPEEEWTELSTKFLTKEI